MLLIHVVKIIQLNPPLWLAELNQRVFVVSYGTLCFVSFYRVGERVCACMVSSSSRNYNLIEAGCLFESSVNTICCQLPLHTLVGFERTTATSTRTLQYHICSGRFIAVDMVTTKFIINFIVRHSAMFNSVHWPAMPTMMIK